MAIEDILIMTTEEKTNKVKEYFNMQKEVILNINITNYFESINKIRYLELQKEIIKAIPINTKI